MVLLAAAGVPVNAETGVPTCVRVASLSALIQKAERVLGSLYPPE